MCTKVILHSIPMRIMVCNLNLKMILLNPSSSSGTLPSQHCLPLVLEISQLKVCRKKSSFLSSYSLVLPFSPILWVTLLKFSWATSLLNTLGITKSYRNGLRYLQNSTKHNRCRKRWSLESKTSFSSTGWTIHFSPSSQMMIRGSYQNCQLPL